MNHNQPPIPPPEDETTRLIREAAATMGVDSNPTPELAQASIPENSRDDPTVVSLPEQHRDALRHKVTVRLCFGRHGAIDAVPGHGVAILGVEDQHYAEVADFVERFDSRQGDAIGLEAEGYESEFSPATFLDQIKDLFLQSRYMTEDDVRAVLRTGNSISDNTSVWEKARRLQIIDPFDYGIGLALSKGVQIRHADAQADECSELKEHSARAIKDHDLKRDARTIERLGSMADNVAVKPDARRKPMLGLLRGKHHGPTIEHFLQEEGVPYTTDVQGENVSETRVWLRTLANLARGKTYEDQVIALRQKWLNNLPPDA